MTRLALKAIHPTWKNQVSEALNKVDKKYLSTLVQENNWLPGADKIFNAFSIPLPQIHYILLGESPYPRQTSANGYAFWDGAVQEIWAEPPKLSKTVNRATSLRNFIKMLIKTHGGIPWDHIQTLSELFQNLLNHGFLLLNASLVLSPTRPVKIDAKYWQPFIETLLNNLYDINPHIELILFGKIAQQIKPLLNKPYKIIQTEHPYNLSFIDNKVVQDYFRPFNLLRHTPATDQNSGIDKSRQKLNLIL